jgi:hypothetical protein
VPLGFLPRLRSSGEWVRWTWPRLLGYGKRRLQKKGRVMLLHYEVSGIADTHLLESTLSSGPDSLRGPLACISRAP